MKHPEEKHPPSTVNSVVNSGIKRVLETVHKLRAPGGCPWDQKQTHESLKPYLIEEAYEVLEVIESSKGNVYSQKEFFKEELGDLLMQVLIHSEIAQEAGEFSFDDVANTLNEKLIRRHPHVFGEKVDDKLNAEQALESWNQQKEKEKSQLQKPLLSQIPKSFPALARADKVIQTVTKVGFQWPDLKGPLDKVDEELQELKKELSAGNHSKASEELGDLLFSLCNVAFKLKQNPEELLRNFLNKFETRFNFVEKQVLAHEGDFKNSSLEKMDQYWNESKAREKNET